jgi:hypothetical protein
LPRFWPVTRLREFASNIKSAGEPYPDRNRQEANSLRTERIHLAHIERVLGTETPLDSINLAAAQRHANLRGKETHAKKIKRPIRPYTVRRELKSFRHVWTWCQRRELVPLGPDWDLSEITLSRDRELEPFRTIVEIKERIERGNLSPAEQKALWECLYLTGPDLMELLEHIGTVPLEGFVKPMFAFTI